MKKRPITYLANLITDEHARPNPKLLRIVLAETFTRIDFGHAAPWIYNKGGWIRIAPDTYIEIKGQAKKYALIEAENIPIAPNQLEYESTQDWQFFSLYFEPIPMKECVINIIEEVNPDKNDFNYMNVHVENLIPIIE